jgi:prephenate dehydrogenase
MPRRLGRLVVSDFDTAPAAADLGAGPDAWVCSDLEALADDIESGRLDGGVVPYHDLAAGRHEPALDLLTRRRGLKVSATAVRPGPRGPVMFALIARACAARTGRDRTLLMAHLFDQQGILYRILRVIHDHDINIAHLSNRPDGRQGQYFHFDLECHADDERFRKALAAIRRHVDPAVELEVLGSCPMVPFFPTRLRSALMIGGTGGIGALIGPAFLEREGVAVTYAGRNTAPPYAEIADRFDCVMFAVPLDRTVPVIREVAPRVRPGAVLVNLASRQAEGISAMLRHAPAGAEVLGVHTVFGPATATVIGKNVVVCRTPRSGPASEELVGLFRKRGVVLTESAADRHDALMHTVQTQWHRLLLAVLLAGAESGVAARALLGGGRPLDEGGLLLYCGARVLMLGENLIWGLQVIDGAAGPAEGAAVHAEAADLLARRGPEIAARQAATVHAAASADDRARAAAVTDGVLFALSRAYRRGFDGDAPAASAGTGLLQSARAATVALVLRQHAAGRSLRDLAAFSSPHFLLGLLAGLSTAELSPGELARVWSEADGGAALLAAHRRLTDLTARGDREGFRAMLGRVREWLGEDFIAFAMQQTTRVFEQVLVAQASELPKF